MTGQEIEHYIRVRNGELSSDEILIVTDTTRNPCISKILYENGTYILWDDNGIRHSFVKRTWS